MAARSETARAVAKLKAIRRTREGLAETVREALDMGLTPTQIRDLSGLSRQTIYNVTARTAKPDTEEPPS